MTIMLVNVDDTYIFDIASALIESNSPVSTIVTKKKPESFPDRSLLVIPSDRLCNIEYLLEFAYSTQDNLVSYENPGKFCELERMYYILSDVDHLEPIPVKQRKQLFRTLLAYWTKVIGAKKIQHVFFPHTPSEGWGIVLFAVAKALRISTTILTRTAIRDRILLADNYSFLEKIPSSYKSDLSVGELETLADKQLLERVYQPSAWSSYSKKRNQDVMLQVREPREVEFEGNPKMQAYWQKVQQLHSLYKQLSVAPDYSVSYVYYALHCDPGRTTQPEGGVFEDQLLAIETLSAALPENWYLFVKEHPRQFEVSEQALKQLHYRDEQDYIRITALPNVRLISTEEAAEKLIEQARIVSTVTGSVGWQGLLAGKAVLNFGAPWYAICDCAYQVRSVQECKDAIADSMTMSSMQFKTHFLRFLIYVNERAILGSSRKVFADLSTETYKSLIESPVKALVEKFST